MDNDKLNGAYRALAIAATEMYGAWMESLPEDQRDDLVREIQHDGAGAGIRFLFADPGRMAQLTFLRLARCGDIEAIGEVKFAR